MGVSVHLSQVICLNTVYLSFEFCRQTQVTKYIERAGSEYRDQWEKNAIYAYSSLFQDQLVDLKIVRYCRLFRQFFKMKVGRLNKILTVSPDSGKYLT
jgi:hypothetical protein